MMHIINISMETFNITGMVQGVKECSRDDVILVVEPLRYVAPCNCYGIA